MKYKSCSTDLPEIKKTLIVDNVEYETETHDFNKTLSEIKIPKGWRLWTVEECKKLFNSHEKRLNLSDCWFFIKQPFNKFEGKYVARFFADSGWARLDCYGGPACSNALLGVRFCKDLSKLKKVKVMEKK
jgi:hypothetical protein